MGDFLFFPIHLVRRCFGWLANIARIASFMARPELTEEQIDLQVAEMYLRALRRLVIAILLFPVPIFLIGLAGEWNWLVAGIGLFWSLCTLATLAIASPLGVVLAAFLTKRKALRTAPEKETGKSKTNKDGGTSEYTLTFKDKEEVRSLAKRYVNFVLWALIIELAVTLYVSVVPIRNNPKLFVVALIAACLAATIAIRRKRTEFFESFTFSAAIIVLVLSTFAFAFPQIAKGMHHVAERTDEVVGGVMQGKISVFSETKPKPGAQALPFCDKDGAKIEGWGKFPLLVQMKKDCWTVIQLSDEWRYGSFDCRDLENRGILYWSRSSRGAVFMRPNTHYPYSDRLFYVLGEGKLRCDYLGR